MPIYEFYCSACNMLFNFFSPRIDTETLPQCPRCEQQRLERRPARFAMLKHAGKGGDEPEDELFPGLDEDRIEQAMGSLAGEFDAMESEEDPRQMARFFRRFGDVAGLQLGPRMEEMLQRLESGEDPDALESDLGDELDEGDDAAMEEWFQLKQKAQDALGRRRKPRLDEKLYFL